MELYEVTIGYRDVSGEEAWEKSLAGTTPRPKPSRKECSVYVAVRPEWAGDPVGRACDVAVVKSLGGKELWEKYQPVIRSVRHMGSVKVESD